MSFQKFYVWYRSFCRCHISTIRRQIQLGLIIRLDLTDLNVFQTSKLLTLILHQMVWWLLNVFPTFDLQLNVIQNMNNETWWDAEHFKIYFLLANELICNTIYIEITYGNSIPLRMSVTVMRLYVFLPHYSLICYHITENSLDKKIMILLFPMNKLMDEKLDS